MDGDSSLQASSAKEQLLIESVNRSETISVCQRCAEKAYVSLQVPPGFDSIQTLTIEVTSHDQGFANDPTHSYSHCCIQIIDAGGHEKRRWDRFWNRIGNSEPHTQKLEWPRPEHETEFHISHLILQSIRPLDHIEVVPVAFYPSWRNHVLSASITITARTSMHRVAEGMHRASTLPILTEQGHEFAVRRARTLPYAHQRYQPLRKPLKEIRLLSILPGATHDKIQCELMHTSLSNKHHTAYEALSYCWGELRDVKTIQVSGEPLSITSNLLDALYRLRKPDQARTMWVDAICIDQTNTTERASQVQQMKLIYSRASRVIVWLGEVNKLMWPDDFTSIMAVMHNDPPVEAVHTTTDEIEAVTEQDLCDFLPENLQHGRRLVLNDWFHRVWVLQEVFNAKDIQVLAGDQVCTWSLIMRLVEYEQRFRSLMRDYRRVMPALFAGLFPLVKVTSRSQSSHLSYTTRQAESDTLDVLVAGLDLDASDPRDKLYALLQFTTDSMEPVLQPNYEKPARVVFRDLTRWWIKSRQSLRILSTIHCSAGRTWRSWDTRVPYQYTSSRPSWSMWYDGKSVFGAATLGLPLHYGFKASGTTNVDLDLLTGQDDSILSLRGVLIDDIASISMFPYYATFLGSEDPTLLRLRLPYEKLFDVDSNAMIHDTGPRAKALDFYAEEQTEDRPSKDFEHFYAHEEFSGRTNAIQCHGDSFFHTTKGLAGLSPHLAQSGDLVVVLHGATVPFLIRKHQGDREDAMKSKQQYTLVGECYLPDYMQGEAVQNGLLEEKIFHLV